MMQPIGLLSLASQPTKGRAGRGQADTKPPNKSPSQARRRNPQVGEAVWLRKWVDDTEAGITRGMSLSDPAREEYKRRKARLVFLESESANSGRQGSPTRGKADVNNLTATPEARRQAAGRPLPGLIGIAAGQAKPPTGPPRTPLQEFRHEISPEARRELQRAKAQEKKELAYRQKLAREFIRQEDFRKSAELYEKIDAGNPHREHTYYFATDGGKVAPPNTRKTSVTKTFARTATAPIRAIGRAADLSGIGQTLRNTEGVTEADAQVFDMAMGQALLAILGAGGGGVAYGANAIQNVSDFGSITAELLESKDNGGAALNALMTLGFGTKGGEALLGGLARGGASGARKAVASLTPALGEVPAPAIILPRGVRQSPERARWASPRQGAPMPEGRSGARVRSSPRQGIQPQASGSGPTRLPGDSANSVRNAPEGGNAAYAGNRRYDLDGPVDAPRKAKETPLQKRMRILAKLPDGEAPAFTPPRGHLVSEGKGRDSLLKAIDAEKGFNIDHRTAKVMERWVNKTDERLLDFVLGFKNAIHEDITKLAYGSYGFTKHLDPAKVRSEITLAREYRYKALHTLAHEHAHYLQNFLDADDLEILLRQYDREMDRDWFHHRRNKKTMRKHEIESRRYVSFSEWWADSVADHMDRTEFRSQLIDLKTKNPLERALRKSVLKVQNTLTNLHRYYLRGGGQDEMKRVFEDIRRSPTRQNLTNLSKDQIAPGLEQLLKDLDPTRVRMPR